MCRPSSICWYGETQLHVARVLRLTQMVVLASAVFKLGRFVLYEATERGQSWPLKFRFRDGRASGYRNWGAGDHHVIHPEAPYRCARGYGRMCLGYWRTMHCGLWRQIHLHQNLTARHNVNLCFEILHELN